MTISHIIHTGVNKHITYFYSFLMVLYLSQILHVPVTGLFTPRQTYEQQTLYRSKLSKWV